MNGPFVIPRLRKKERKQNMSRSSGIPGKSKLITVIAVINRYGRVKSIAIYESLQAATAGHGRGMLACFICICCLHVVCYFVLHIRYIW